MDDFPIGLAEALQSLRPKAQWVFSENKLDWHDKIQTQPTDAEIQAEIVRLQTEYDKNKYQRDRKPMYPDIEECVHAILDGELDDLQIKRQAIKEKYPKE
jgi:hypothetical protein